MYYTSQNEYDVTAADQVKCNINNDCCFHLDMCTFFAITSVFCGASQCGNIWGHPRLTGSFFLPVSHSSFSNQGFDNKEGVKLLKGFYVFFFFFCLLCLALLHSDSLRKVILIILQLIYFSKWWTWSHLSRAGHR